MSLCYRMKNGTMIDLGFRDRAELHAAVAGAQEREARFTRSYGDDAVFGFVGRDVHDRATTALLAAGIADPTEEQLLGALMLAERATAKPSPDAGRGELYAEQYDASTPVTLATSTSGKGKSKSYRVELGQRRAYAIDLHTEDVAS
jgi:hypothetical protein